MRAHKCYLADEDLNAWMVREGWALAYVKYSSAYVRAEENARTQQRGLWQGAFIAPWDWRHRNNKTVILVLTASRPMHRKSYWGRLRLKVRRHLNARLKAMSVAMANGSIILRVKDFTRELGWIKVAIGVGSVRQRLQKRQDGGERLGEAE